MPILLGDKEKVLEVCRDLQRTLAAAGMRVQLDTSDERPGAKFYKWEMKGVPIRLEVGPRDIEKGVVTLVRRDGMKKAVPMEGLVEALVREAEELQAALLLEARSSYDRARSRRSQALAKPRQQTENGVALVPWCGSEDCGHQLEDQVEANMLGEPQYQSFSHAGLRRMWQEEHWAHLHGQAVLRLR